MPNCLKKYKLYLYFALIFDLVNTRSTGQVLAYMYVVEDITFIYTLSMRSLLNLLRPGDVYMRQ